MNETDYVYGKNSVTEILENSQRKVNKILILKTGRFDKRIDNIIKLAKEKNIPFSFADKEAFSKFAGESHQGTVAYVSPIEYTDLNTFLKKETGDYKRVIILDGTEDPHNTGSIIRTAVCAGYDGIIISKHRNSMINATVEKCSAGAVNRIDIICVNSLQNALTVLKDNDFWIIATDIDAKDNYFDIDYTNMNFAIITGSEKSGISKTCVKNSDFRVKIPMYAKFDSLNAANATSIVIYETVRQRTKGGK